MNDRLLVERLSAEIQNASTARDHARARKLAALQREVLARLMRDIAADPHIDVLTIPPRSQPAVRKPRQPVAH